MKTNIFNSIQSQLILFYSITMIVVILTIAGGFYLEFPSIHHERRFFIGLLVLSLLLSLLAGKLVTQRGLKSLNGLTNTVKAITASSLNHRVDPECLPKELKHISQAFNEMLERLETGVTRLHQLAADLSHELRTPINNLLGQTELLLSYKHSEADYRNAQASNLEELQRMASLIENILFLARTDSLQLNIDKQQIEASDEITKVCEYYQALAEDKNMTLVFEGQAKLHFNTVMFRRLLNNLISNSIKYSKPDSTIRISAAEGLNHVVITVADEGIGIAAQHLPHIFDRFYRVDDSRSKQINGTGLGLAIVKSIVDLHSGHIAVRSEEGVGTTIEIVLPARA